MTVDVTIASSGHDVADARLHRICAALVAAGLSVEIRALGAAAAAPPGLAAVHTEPRGGFVARARRALSLALRSRGDVVLVVDPDAAVIASVVVPLRRRRLVVDVHEDYAALVADRAWSPARRRVARLVAGVATHRAAKAALTVVADDHVPPLQAAHRLVVRNLPDLTHLTPAGAPEPQPRAIYIGDVRRSRGLQTMLQAIEQAPDWTLDVIGPVSPHDEAWLRDWQATSPAAARVRLHGRMPPREAWAHAAGAWAGLVLLDDTPAFRDACPTKLYEYLAAGLGVVASPLPRMASLLAEAQTGALAAGAPAAAAALRAWSDDPARLERDRLAALRWAERSLQGPSPYALLAEEVGRLVRHRPCPPQPRRSPSETLEEWV